MSYKNMELDVVAELSKERGYIVMVDCQGLSKSDTYEKLREWEARFRDIGLSVVCIAKRPDKEVEVCCDCDDAYVKEFTKDRDL